jgi:flagellar basal-body rod protein FlgF
MASPLPRSAFGSLPTRWRCAPGRHDVFAGGELSPAEGATVMQGLLEDSNVKPVSEIARMIEVQRAYELGQKFLDAEDERVRGVIQTLGR